MAMPDLRAIRFETQEPTDPQEFIMTDHSILRPSLPDLPFQAEARLISNILAGLFVRLPKAFAQALYAQRIYDGLNAMDNQGLTALGVKRDEIARYTFEQAWSSK
jgi:hypothetical protein